MADLAEARDEIIKAYGDALKAAALLAAIDVNPNLVISAFDADNVPDIAKLAPNSGNKPWARLTLQHTDSQSMLGGKKRRVFGATIFQFFARTSTTDAAGKSQLIASTVSRIIAKHSGAVNFTGVTAIERPQNSGFAQTDVNARFWYIERL